MTYESILRDANEKMDKALTHMVDILRSVRTGRASPALVENVRVDYYGTPTPVSQLASISVPEPRQILIKPFDASVLQELSKAIMKSDLGITPQKEGNVLRLNLPQLSGEQRTKFAAKVKEFCEDGRIAMRNTRRDLNKAADAMKKSGEITEDDNKKLHEEIQKLLKAHEDKVHDIQEKKTTEILSV